MKEFAALVDQIVQPIHAGNTRKESMREELLAHLSAAYDEELRRCPDAQAAADAVRRRFGNADELTRQLQSLVPLLERLTARFRAKETPMSRWFWVICWIALIIVVMFFAPDNDFRMMLAVVAIIGAAGVVRLSQESNAVTRWFGPRWGWRILAVLSGPAIILPALAKLKHEQALSAVVVPLTLGIVIVLIGIGSFAHSLASRFMRPSTN